MESFIALIETYLYISESDLVRSNLALSPLRQSSRNNN